MRPAVLVALTREERRCLEAWRDAPDASPRLVRRARIVLAASRGRTNRSIAAELGLDPETVALWRRRFSVNRLDGIRHDAPRAGRRPALPPGLIERIARIPPDALRPDGSRWTTRQVAGSLGISHMRVHRAWQAQRLWSRGGAHARSGTPALRAERRVDVAGIYLSPPCRAIVFAVGTFFEPNVPDVTVVEPALGPMFSDGSHSSWEGLLGALDRWGCESETGAPGATTAQDFLVFLRTIEHSLPAPTELHVLIDRFAPAANHRIERWMLGRPRLHRYRVPAGSTWIDAVDRWWSRWTTEERREPSRRHVGDCAECLLHFLGEQNPALSPFAWTSAFPAPSERRASD